MRNLLLAVALYTDEGIYPPGQEIKHPSLKFYKPCEFTPIIDRTQTPRFNSYDLIELVSFCKGVDTYYTHKDAFVSD